MHAPVKRIGAALGDDIDASGHGISDDGRRGAFGDAQFLNGVVVHSVDEADSLIGVVTREIYVVAGIGAVHHEVVTHRWEAVDVFAAALGTGTVQAGYEW